MGLNRLAHGLGRFRWLLFALGVLVWHTTMRGGNWLPLEDNFEAFIWLAILLAAFVLYVQRAKALGGLDWFVTPIAIVLLMPEPGN